MLPEIKDNLIFQCQAMLVTEIQDLLHECYLEVLIEAVDHGNPSKLKVQKAKVTLEPTHFQPDDEEMNGGFDQGAANWFTLKGLVSDMWRSFKFEPYIAKVQLLFKSVDFKADDQTMFMLRKHVELRNCVQHHNGQLTPEALKSLGRESLEILGVPESPLFKWKRIRFTYEELLELCDSICAFADSFESYVDKRVHSRHYLPPALAAKYGLVRKSTTRRAR